MRTRIVATLLALTVCVAPVFGATWTYLAKYLRPGVLFVQGTDDDPQRIQPDYCTAFIIAKGRALTAGHCVRPDRDDYELSVDGRPAQLIKYHQYVNNVNIREDIALLAFEPEKTDRILVLAPHDAILGNPIGTVGYAYAFGYQFQMGYVQLAHWSNTGMMFIDLNVYSGDSGGPIFNALGQVIGLNIAVLTRNSPTMHFTLAMTVSEIQNFLSRK